MKRVVVVGAAGSGKTTLARALSEHMNAPATDLDGLFWAPQWGRVPLQEFRERALDRAGRETWLIAGNFFRQVSDLVWPRADTVVWLDLPRRLTVLRVVRRTLRQAVRREEIFPGCRQSLWAAWRDGLFRTSWQESARNRVLIPDLLYRPENAHLTLVRLRTRAEVAAWLAAQRTGTGTHQRTELER